MKYAEHLALEVKREAIEAQRAKFRSRAASGKCRACEFDEVIPALGRMDVPFNGLQSLLINVHNEGPDLLSTIRSFKARCLSPLEVLVFADMTTDDSLDNLPRGTQLFHHKGPEPFGCGRAKDFLASKARGSFIWHTDGHNRVARGMLDQGARWGSYVPCVVQPALGPLHQKPHECRAEPAPNNCYHGGNLSFEKGLPNIHQTTLRPDRRIKKVGCVNNSCFGYPRALLQKFGGWHAFPGRWGFQEAAFSIRLWFAGVPIYCLRDDVLAVLHRYQDWWDGPDAGEYKGKRKSYSVAGWHRRVNRRYATRVIFDDITWQRFWKPQFELVDRDSDGKANAALADSAVEAQRIAFAKVKKRTDEEWFKEVAKMDFNPAAAKVNDGVTRGLYLLTGGLGNALMCVPAIKALAKLSGEPVDIWDRGLHVKGLKEWLGHQPWTHAVIDKDTSVDYREYRFIIGSYWASPDISTLEGCTITQAFRQHRTKHEAYSSMEALWSAGYKGPTPSPFLDIPSSGLQSPVSSLDGEAVVICTEAAGRRDDVNKCYPHWEAVCRQLKAAGVPLIFLGNNEDVPAWMAEVGECLVGKTEFMAAVEIVRRARLYVGIDNGLAHVATAVHTPTVLVYGPTSPRKNLQLTQAVHVISSNFRCAPCFDTPRKDHCKAEPKGAMPCMREIAPERVARKVVHLLDTPYAEALPAQQVFLSRKQMVENCHLEMFQQWDELTRLLDVIRPIDPQRVLVIGTHHGAWELVVSGVCAPGTEFIMVDLEDFPERKLAEELLHDFGYKTTFIKGDSTAIETVERVREALAGNQVGVLYIDGYHEYDYVDADFRNYGELVQPGGIAVFHDVANFVNDDAPGSRKHWEEVKNSKDHWMTMEIRAGRNNGFGVVFVAPRKQ